MLCVTWLRADPSAGSSSRSDSLRTKTRAISRPLSANLEKGPRDVPTTRHGQQKWLHQCFLDLCRRDGHQCDRERVIFGGGIAGAGSDDAIAMYAAARSISLALVVLAIASFRSRDGIAAMAVTMGLVQLLDAGIGFLSHDPFKTYGPLVISLITFASLAWLLRTLPDAGIGRRVYRPAGSGAVNADEKLRERVAVSVEVNAKAIPKNV
jgi:hypothetical protein